MIHERQKMGRLNFFKIKNFCFAKDTFEGIKSESTVLENIFTETNNTRFLKHTWNF